MSSNSVQEIERAIGSLNEQELEELYGWLDQQPRPIDLRIESDLLNGRMDAAISRALQEEKNGAVEPF